MAFTERLQTIDRRVAYGAALVIALGGLAADCTYDADDAGDGRIRTSVSTEQHVVTRDETADVSAGPEMFDLQTLNLVEAPQQ